MISLLWSITVPVIFSIAYYYYYYYVYYYDDSNNIQQRRRQSTDDTTFTTKTTSSFTSNKYQNNNNIDVCRYYLAESTIPNAGWGIFTFHTLYENDPISTTTGESGIPVIDLTNHHGTYIHTLYYNYMWNADVTGSHNEGGGRTIYTRINHNNNNSNSSSGSSQSQQSQSQQQLPGNVLNVITGIGMLANGHPLDYNIVPYQIPIPHPPLLNTKQSLSTTGTTSSTTNFVISRHSLAPTTGAITYYHHLQYFAYNHHKKQQQQEQSTTTTKKRNNNNNNNKVIAVPAGGELIINYGTGWNTRYDFHQYRIHPPERPQQNIHSLFYLQQYGYCIDTIISSYPQVSNIIPHAGYGGLARRYIHQNTVIVPVPIIPIHRYGLYMEPKDIHTTTSSTTTMSATTTTSTTTTPNNNNDDEMEDEFDEEFDEEFDATYQSSSSSSSSSSTNSKNNNVRPKQQLLLNYVLGHVHSNILLVPYGPGMHLINHHATQYNAKLRWSIPATTTSNRRRPPSWILDPDQITVSQLMEEQPGGKLLLELIAIRDIEPGEEILIHYGTAWEHAYQQHVHEWEHQQQQHNYNKTEQSQQHPSQEYVYAYDMNQRVEHQILLRTEHEQFIDPYPYNLQLECYYVPHLYRTATMTTTTTTTTEDTTNHIVKWDPTKVPVSINPQQMYHPNQLRPCQILQRQQPKQSTGSNNDNSTQYVYDVQLMDIPYIIHDVPRHMITFRDVPYTQDQHMEHVFRHEIQLPDDVFPSHWKDLL